MHGNDGTSSGSGILTALQKSILEMLSREDPSLFLTGGSALGEFYLHHRRSQDLHLFTTDEQAFAHSERLVTHVARKLDLTASILRTGAGFRRFLLEKGGEQIVLDIVHDTVPQIDPGKGVLDGIQVDTFREIAVNKVCALLSRSEVKDLVDLYFISRKGLDPVDLLPLGGRKDGGLTPAALAYSLSRIPLDSLPADMVVAVSREEVSAFRDGLVDRLTELAVPGRRKPAP